MGRRVARHPQRFEGDAGELDDLVPGEQHVRSVRAQVQARRDVIVDLLEELSFGLGHVHGRAGSLGEIGYGAEVIPVPVRDQDADAAGTTPRQFEPQLGDVCAGVDDDCFRRARDADEVTVRLERSKRKPGNVQTHRGVSLTSVRFRLGDELRPQHVHQQAVVPGSVRHLAHSSA